MNAAIYARVSTEWQAEHGYSIGTQLEACREKAKALDAFVVKEYVDDGYSGGFLERPALEQLRDAVQDGLYDIVICHDADRLSRKLIHQLILTEEFEKYNCRPVFVQGEVSDTPEGNMSYQMKGVFAEYERAKIRERTMRGKRAKLKAGKVINDSHIYGYDFDRENSCYVINPAEAEVVKTVYKWYVDDRYGGCEAIAARLNDMATPTPTGSGLWSASTIQHMLKRSHYTGRYYASTQYHKKTGPKSYVRLPRPREEWIEMTCPRILPDDMHTKALDIMSSHRTYKTWAHAQDTGIMQGFAHCGFCGHRLRIATTKKTQKYYACGDKCKRSRYMGVAYTDELFWSLLESICKNQKTLKAYIAAQRDELPKAPAPQQKRQKLKKRLDKIQAERKAVMSWFSQALIGQQEATEKLQALKAEESTLQAELAASEASQGVSPDNALDVKDICEVVRNCPADKHAKRRVLLAIIDRIDIARLDNNYGHKYDLDINIIFK